MENCAVCNQPIDSSHRCPDCHRPVHRFCGTPFGKDEEGYGQRIWCSKSERCQLKNNPAPEIISLPKIPQKGKLSPSKRARIWEIHEKNPELSQAKLAEKAKNEFKLEKLTQATISTVLKEFSVSMAKYGHLTMEKCHRIREKSRQSPRMTQKSLAEWAQKGIQTRETFDAACDF